MDVAALFPWLLFLLFLPVASFGVGYFMHAATVRVARRKRIEHLRARHAKHSQETGLASLIDQELNAHGLVPMIKRMVFGRQELREFGMIMSFEQVLEVAGLPKWLRNTSPVSSKRFSTCSNASSRCHLATIETKTTANPRFRKA